VDNDVLGRTDLLSLPCACVDAVHATFRDDAIGIRPQSSTGRRTNAAASKWEVLVHVTNVSNLYFESEEDNDAVAPGRSDSYVRVLQEAA
jgi:exoribonuclease R